jgi:hypothetical protein
MSSTETILQFLTFLADVQAIFRDVHLRAQKNGALRDVSTKVIPFRCSPSAYADGGVTISVALNAELLQPSDSEKKAMGMSLLLRHTGGMWVAEAEVGWTGEMVGWDQFDAQEAQYPSIEEMILQVPLLVKWMGTRFEEEIAKGAR